MSGSAKRAVISLGGRGLTGFLGSLGLLACYAAAAPMLGLPGERELRPLLRGLGVPPSLLLVLGLALVVLGAFGHVRPLVHLRVDPAARSVSLVRFWRTVKTLTFGQTGSVSVRRKTSKFETRQVKGTTTSYCVYLDQVADFSLFESSSEDAARRWGAGLAQRIETRMH